jgi:hypothetical protein
MGFQLTTLVVIGIFWSNCCRVLFKEVYKMQRKIPRLGILQEGENGKLSLVDGICFHLYISKAPCGDGSLFSQR